jgi:hydrogenase nickel incorporation protein HypA/HybF
MREMHAAQSIFSQVLRQVQQTNAQRVKGVQIAFGEMAELDRDTIQKCWEDVGRGTPVEHAQLRFRFIQAEVQCMACFQKYHPVDGNIHCPYCGSYGAKILSGEEFYLESIELGDA